MKSKAPIRHFVFRDVSVQLFVPDQSFIISQYQDGSLTSPYWSQVWPASIALSEFISNHSHLVLEKEVLELGAGLGLPSMMAAHYARSVICSDYESKAVELIKQSAQLNGLSNLKALCLDWNNLSPELKPDVLLLSDINYDQAAFEKLTSVLERFLEQETTIILSTPQRLMAKIFIAPLLTDCIQQETISTMQDSTTVSITLLVLKR